MNAPLTGGLQNLRFDKRYLAPVLVTIVLIVGQVTFGFLESWSRTALAIGTSIAVELVLGRLFGGRWPPEWAAPDPAWGSTSATSPRFSSPSSSSPGS